MVADREPGVSKLKTPPPIRRNVEVDTNTTRRELSLVSFFEETESMLRRYGAADCQKSATPKLSLKAIALHLYRHPTGKFDNPSPDLEHWYLSFRNCYHRNHKALKASRMPTPGRTAGGATGAGFLGHFCNDLSHNSKGHGVQIPSQRRES
jgi:hypothetical protein